MLQFTSSKKKKLYNIKKSQNTTTKILAWNYIGFTSVLFIMHFLTYIMSCGKTEKLN